MSVRRLFQSAWPRLLSRFWGARIKDQDGVRKDTGVNPAMEELAAILSSEAPIELNAPITLINKTNGPAIHIINQGPTDQTQGIRIEDELDRITDVGIGLGSRNLLANSYIPLASADIDPLKAWLFYGKNEQLTYKDLDTIGKDKPPGADDDKVDPGLTYQKGQEIVPGGEYGGGGTGDGNGTTLDNRSLAFNYHKITNVNRIFQNFGGAQGLSDTITIVTDITCNAGTLSVTYKDFTFNNGILVDVS